MGLWFEIVKSFAICQVTGLSVPTRRSLRLSFRPSWDQKKFSAQKQLAHMYLSKLQICIWDKKKVLCTKTNLYLLKLQICICLFCQINLCKLHNVFVFPAELRQEKSFLGLSVFVQIASKYLSKLQNVFVFPAELGPRKKFSGLPGKSNWQICSN